MNTNKFLFVCNYLFFTINNSRSRIVPRESKYFKSICGSRRALYSYICIKNEYYDGFAVGVLLLCISVTMSLILECMRGTLCLSYTLVQLGVEFERCNRTPPSAPTQNLCYIKKTAKNKRLFYLYVWVLNTSSYLFIKKKSKIVYIC